MDNKNEQLETLSEIRSLMERSTRFISLSGLSGVFAGIFALAGAFAAYLYFHMGFNSRYYEYAFNEFGGTNINFYVFFFTDGALVLIASLAVGSFLTMRKAKQKGQIIWGAPAKRLMINLLIPLISGGLFCLILLYHGIIWMVAPATLVFYGLALLNASKYTLDDIRYLGICEIILGLVASIYIGQGLVFWAIGFGVLHIIYGIVMFNKYE
jgi:hypothetical protein